MATILGDGAFRIWIGKDKITNRNNNIGIRIQEKKFPTGVDLEKTIEQLAKDIEALIYRRCPWCK
tara:strand:- start:347 stop:541 length:195 start_codon:yes stop_codon:yes gene_type:complete